MMYARTKCFRPQFLTNLMCDYLQDFSTMARNKLFQEKQARNKDLMMEKSPLIKELRYEIIFCLFFFCRKVKIDLQENMWGDHI